MYDLHDPYSVTGLIAFQLHVGSAVVKKKHLINPFGY